MSSLKDKRLFLPTVLRCTKYSQFPLSFSFLSQFFLFLQFCSLCSIFVPLKHNSVYKFQHLFELASRDGTVVRTLTSHQCDPGSIPGLGVICGLSLSLVLDLALQAFSPDTPVFPSPPKPAFPNSNSPLDTVDEEPLSVMCHCQFLLFFLCF